MDELRAALIAEIRNHVATSPLNRLRDIDGAPMYEEPLVGFADGDDTLFELYKAVVAPEHMTPREALAQSAPDRPPRVGVVAWVLPIAAQTRLSNRQMADRASVRWNHTRFQGEEFNENLRRHVVALLAGWGVAAVAPALSAGWHRTRGAWGLASTWSERHAAYAAGLGTFGLSDGLITPRGVAHRCGSVVAAAEWLADVRPYTDRHAYCPYFYDGSCRACIQRCPAGAIGPDGHDKEACRAFIGRSVDEPLRNEGYIGGYLACGLCQTGVPCEATIPRRRPADGDRPPAGG